MFNFTSQETRQAVENANREHEPCCDAEDYADLVGEDLRYHPAISYATWETYAI